MRLGSDAIALGFPGGGLALEHCWVRQTPAQALAAEDRELQLRHVEPATVLGRVVKLQPLHEAAPPRAGRSGIEPQGCGC